MKKNLFSILCILFAACILLTGCDLLSGGKKDKGGPLVGEWVHVEHFDGPPTYDQILNKMVFTEKTWKMYGVNVGEYEDAIDEWKDGTRDKFPEPTYSSQPSYFGTYSLKGTSLTFTLDASLSPTGDPIEMPATFSSTKIEIDEGEGTAEYVRKSSLSKPARE